MPVWYISNTNKRILSSEKREREKYDILLEDQMDDINFRKERSRTASATILGNSGFLVLEVDFFTKNRSYLSKFFLRNETNSSDAYFFLQRTRNRSLETNQGITVGDVLSTVQQAYKGTYFQVVHHNKGFFLVYPSKGLIFQIDTNNRVREWAVFAEY